MAKSGAKNRRGPGNRQRTGGPQRPGSGQQRPAGAAEAARTASAEGEGFWHRAAVGLLTLALTMRKKRSAPMPARAASAPSAPPQGGGQAAQGGPTKDRKDPMHAPPEAANERGRGRQAEGPMQIPPKGWKDVLWRVWTEFNEDRLMLVAAGATFYLLLALFPFLAAFVSLYGFVADPNTIAEHIAFLGGILPSGGVELIEGELKRLASQETEALSFGFIAGVLIALWSANSGVKALFDGLNIAYDEEEKRSFIWLNVVSFAFTLGAILIGFSFIFAVGIVPAILAFLRLDGWAETLIAVGRWPVLLAAIILAIMVFYRYGPSRARAKLRWVSWGAVISAVVWIATSWAFSFYLQNFADYNATYGTLGAVIGFMIWTWISVMILLLGAELNSELEHQTAKDSTTGPERPMGARGAVMADTLGKSADGK